MRVSTMLFVRTSVLAAGIALLAASPARADYGIVSPDAIDFGKLLIQHDGDVGVSPRSGSGGAQDYTISVGTGVTRWWDAVIELATSHAPGDGQPSGVTQAVLTSTFELTTPGEAFVDASLYLEYGQSVTHGHGAGNGANEVTFGPAIGKDIGPTTHTINLFLTRLLGPDQSTPGMDFSYAWQSRWNVWDKLSPAVEIYGDAGTLGHMPRLSEQQVMVGPVALGTLGLAELGLGCGPAAQLRYELGWLFGVTPAAPSGALRWHLELEIPF